MTNETQTESFKLNWSAKENAVRLLEQEKAFRELDIEVFE